MMSEGKVQTLVNDIRHALRLFRKAPFWTLSVAGTLALGIGAATAMFSVGNAVLLRPLPYPEPERLVVLWGRNPQKGLEQERDTLADFADWRARAHVFDEIGFSFLWPGSRARIVRTSTQSELVHSAVVSSAWLRALGLQPVRGRIFTPDEDRRGTNLVAVISDRFWQRQFARDGAVLGRMLSIDSFDLKKYQIVGVMPPGLQYPPETDVWLSMGAEQFEPPPPGAGKRCCGWLEVVARLRRGISVEQGRREVGGVQSPVFARHGAPARHPPGQIIALAPHLP